MPMAHPGSEVGNQSSCINSGGTNYAQQEPGQDPGSSHPQHPVVARPVFYIHAPPPPPFLPYQWPMPYPYNPFPGFPAMSYGMIVPPPPLVPPPPPPPFMETPAYFLPHPHVQPVDYRRLLHPQGHTQSGSHRIRPPYTVHIRGTVNSEVQTEPIQRGSSVCVLGSESGRGTASNSPCSPGSNFQTRASVEVLNNMIPHSDAKDSQVETCTSSTVKHGIDKCQTVVKRCIRATPDMQIEEDMVGQEHSLPLCRDSRMWVSPPDSMVPVCSSPQKQDGINKERHISVPDILMGWGGDSPQATLKVSNEDLLNKHPQSNEHKEASHKSVYHSLTKSASNDCPVLFKILRLPCAFTGTFSDSNRDGDHSESTCIDELQYLPVSSQRFSEHEQEIVTGADQHDLTENNPYKVCLGSSHVIKLDESVWSVESLTPFIPTRDWLLQNGMLALKANGMQENEDVGLSTQHDKAAGQEKSCRLSASDSASLSGSWLDYQTHVVKQSSSKQPEMESNDQDIGGPDPRSSPTPLVNYASPTEEEKCSSEPEAHQSLNQETNGLKEKSSSPEKKTFVLNCAAEEMIQVVTQNGVEVVVENRGPLMAEVSSSRGQLVDCGVQCNKFWEHQCFCENLELNGKKHSDLEANECDATSMGGNLQKRTDQLRKRSRTRQSSGSPQ